ncbi:hypothetical protein FAVG1_00471 [Fusarium avenaceum]|nr:hypothetical protein FAVG1_00471 [Fusarium avenaceum]
MAEDQETIGERVCKTLKDCKKSTGKVFLNEQGHLIVNIDEDDTGTDLSSVTTEHFGDQRLKYMLIPIGEDGELRESPVIIFTPKEKNDNEQNNSPFTGPSQHFTPTKAENAHNEPKFRDGSTHHEIPHQCPIIDGLRQMENTRRHLDSTKASIEVGLAFFKAFQTLLEPGMTCMTEIMALVNAYQARSTEVEALFEVYQARTKPNQVHTVEILALLGAQQARAAGIKVLLDVHQARSSEIIAFCGTYKVCLEPNSS